MISDRDRLRPRVFMHRHKLHETEWSFAGPDKVKAMWERLKPMCVSAVAKDVRNKPKSVFSEFPHVTWDNCFSGNCSLQCAAKDGFGLTMTCRRDRLPKGVPLKHFCELGTNSAARPKAARFENPIFMTKRAEGADSLLQFMTHQSTSSCDFAHANAVNQCQLFAETKERGCGVHK